MELPCQLMEAFQLDELKVKFMKLVKYALLINLFLLFGCSNEIVIEEEVEEVALEGEEGEEGEVAEGEAAEGDDSAEEPKEGGEEASEKGEDTKEG